MASLPAGFDVVRALNERYSFALESVPVVVAVAQDEARFGALRQDKVMTVVEIAAGTGKLTRYPLLRSVLLAKAQERAKALFGSDTGCCRARDLHVLDGLGKLDCAVVARRLCVLVALPPLSVVVLLDRMLVLDCGDDAAYEALRNKYLHVTSEVGGGDFQVAALEAVFATATALLQDDVTKLWGAFKQVAPAADLDHFLSLRLQANRLDRLAHNVLAALTGFLEDEEGLVSHQRIVANPMRYAELSADSFPPCEQLELMAELAVDTASTIAALCDELRREMQESHDALALHADVTQNQLYYMQIVLQCVTSACALPTFVSGMCAMNLLNGFTTLPVQWFWLVFALSVLMLLLGPLWLLLWTREGRTWFISGHAAR